MKKIIIFLIFLSFFSSIQIHAQTKNYVSVGLFDHKTGFSVLGYTRSILQNTNNELFVGCGSMIAFNTFVIGYKKYLLRSFVDSYSVLSMQKIYGMAGNSNAACMSIGVEKRIWKVLFLNVGINMTNILEDRDVLIFPALSLNIRY
tara:strand:+ start:296 stop:733 length:438 start_codon:yes stop_codon:yes gene_type:complete